MPEESSRTDDTDPTRDRRILTFSDGTPLTFSDGTQLEFSDTEPSIEGDKHRHTEPEPVRASSWTGTKSLQEVAHEVRTLVPRFQIALEIIIADLERHGSNNGPPLDDRERILSELRVLHDALGHLLNAAKSSNWGAGNANHMLEISNMVSNVSETLKERPLYWGTLIVIEGFFGAFSIPGANVITNLITASREKSANRSGTAGPKA